VGVSAGLSVLRERGFRLLFVGQFVSLVGDGMLVVALAFAVLDLTGSVSDLGFALAASRAPLVLAILVGGVVADRLPRRAVMVGADLVRLAALALSASLLIVGGARLWELLVLQAIFGTAGGFFYPASTGLLPLIVRPELLQQANGLRGLSQSAGAVIGPAIAGVLVAAAGPGWALAADAASFGVSAGSLALLRLPSHLRPPRQRFLADLVDGWREFRSRTWVWAEVLVAGACGNIFTAAFTALGPAIAKNHLGGASAWAAVLAAQGAGGFLGGLLVLRLRVRKPLVVANLAWGVLVLPDVLLALIAPTAAIAVGALVGGCGLAIGTSLWETTLQRHIPENALSRVSAYDWFGSLAFNPLGLAVMGPVAIAIGTRATLLVAASWFVVSSLTLISVPSIRDLRNEDADMPVQT
jgi:predicted MFS family arabinose efflux permease